MKKVKVLLTVMILGIFLTAASIASAKQEAKAKDDAKEKESTSCCKSTALTCPATKDATCSADKKDAKECEKKAACEPGNQKDCPIMGGKIDKKFFADYKGERVYFCCSACVAKFNEDPDKVIEKCKKDGINLDKVVEDKAIKPEGEKAADSKKDVKDVKSEPAKSEEKPAQKAEDSKDKATK